MKKQYMRVKIRRNIKRNVKPSVEQVDGKIYLFRFGWKMDDNDSYPGEIAMITDDPQYPKEAPVWLASGDLECI